MGSHLRPVPQLIPPTRVTRRYWMAQYKPIKAGHEAKLRRGLAAKDNDRIHGLGGSKPDNGSADDTDEHLPAG